MIGDQCIHGGPFPGCTICGTGKKSDPWDAEGRLAIALATIARLTHERDEARRTLPCGCHHSLDDTYGGCAFHTAMRTINEEDDSYQRDLDSLRADNERLRSELSRALAKLRNNFPDDDREHQTCDCTRCLLRRAPEGGESTP